MTSPTGAQGSGTATLPAKPHRPVELGGHGSAAAPSPPTVRREAPGAAVDVRTVGALASMAVGLCILYALGALVPFWFLSRPSEGVAFFPAAGLTVTTLVLTPRRTWPLWLAVVATTEFIVDVTHHQAAAMAFGFAAANAAEPLLGAVGLTWATHRSRGYFARVLGFMLFPVLVAPALGAVVGATTSALTAPGGHAGWWRTAGTWWVGDALGVLVLGTAVLAWARRSPFEDRAPIAAIVGMSAVAAGVIVGSAVLWQRPLIYAVMPIMVGAAFAGGSRAVTAVGAATAGAAEWAALTGRSQLLGPTAPPSHQLLLLQVIIGVTLLTMLILAAQIAERRRSEHLAGKAILARLRSEEATVRVAEAERRGIARDTHDIVGHGLSAMLVQLGAVRQVVRQDPSLACKLVDSVEAIGRRACRDLDLALGLVGHQATLEPGQGLARLPELAEELAPAGGRVEVVTDGEHRDIPTLVDWSAYRIIQEAMTNVAKHAPGANVTVTVHFDEDELNLSVVDDGGATRGAVQHHGLGIIGMRERAAALGGTLYAGPRMGGGFAVVAKLPW